MTIPEEESFCELGRLVFVEGMIHTFSHHIYNCLYESYDDHATWGGLGRVEIAIKG